MKRYVDVKVLSVSYGTKQHKATGTFQIRGEKEPTPWRATFETRWNVTIDRELSPQAMKQMMMHCQSVLGYVNLPVQRTYEIEV